MKNVPFFSARKFNKIDEYTRFYHLKTLIKSKSEKVSTTSELAKLCGYKDAFKFNGHRKQFDELRRNVPVDYLNAIGIDLEELKRCAEVDMKEFERLKELQPLYPRYGIERIMPGIYNNIEIPDGTIEENAVEMVKSYAKEKMHRCNINYPSFKTIWIEPSGKVLTIYYPPTYRITKHMLIVEESGENIGQSNLR
ncbi:MAG: hypothetical protein DRJ08_04965 [Acidobacteria bacterium]|nr:MAG: hypothetical protein DRJ14_09765 [Acidobacteriota bacterium]RLE21862.1 MAG: hypothetical protein DRJ08_04965 [Acidobacteriota bacterium]